MNWHWQHIYVEWVPPEGSVTPVTSLQSLCSARPYLWPLRDKPYSYIQIINYWGKVFFWLSDVFGNVCPQAALWKSLEELMSRASERQALMGICRMSPQRADNLRTSSKGSTREMVRDMENTIYSHLGIPMCQGQVSSSSHSRKWHGGMKN